jgi:hypothetical protein
VEETKEVLEGFEEDLQIINSWESGSDKYRLVNLGAGPNQLQIFENGKWREESVQYRWSAMSNRIKHLTLLTPKAVTTEKAFSVIKQAMKEDGPEKKGSYAHSWHCNIAMMVHDAILAHDDQVDFAHKVGNDAATRFMKLCFGVDTIG